MCKELETFRYIIHFTLQKYISKIFGLDLKVKNKYYLFRNYNMNPFTVHIVQ